MEQTLKQQLDSYLKTGVVQAVLRRLWTTFADRKQQGRLTIGSGPDNYTDLKDVTLGMMPFFLSDTFSDDPLGKELERIVKKDGYRALWLMVYKTCLAHEVGHINCTTEKGSTYCKETIADWLYQTHGIHKDVGGRFGAVLFNIIEDGRLEGIMTQKYPGLTLPFQFLNSQIRYHNRITKEPEIPQEEFSVFMGTILSYAKTGRLPRGFHFLVNTRAQREFEKIYPGIDRGVTAERCHDCADACIDIAKICGAYISDLLQMESDIANILDQMAPMARYSDQEIDTNQTGNSPVRVVVRRVKKDEEASVDAKNQKENDPSSESSGASDSPDEQEAGQPSEPPEESGDGSTGSSDSDDTESNQESSASPSSSDSEPEEHREDEGKGGSTGKSDEDEDENASGTPESEDSKSGDSGDETSEDEPGRNDSEESSDAPNGEESESSDEDSEEENSGSSDQDGSSPSEEENGSEMDEEDSSEGEGSENEENQFEDSDPSKSDSSLNPDDVAEDESETSPAETDPSSSTEDKKNLSEEFDASLDQTGDHHYEDRENEGWSSEALQQMEELLEKAIRESRTEEMLILKERKNLQSDLDPTEIKNIMDQYAATEGRSTTFTEEPLTLIPEDMPGDLRNRGAILKRDLERILYTKNNRQNNLRRGHLDPTAIWKVGIRDGNVFERKGTKAKDFAFYVLQDCSGSMSGPKEVEATKTMSILEEGIRDLFSLKVVKFCSLGGHVIHQVVKSFADNRKFNHSNCSLTASSARGCNKDGYSIRIALKELQKRPEKKKVLIVLSDGLPSDYRGGHQTAILDVKTAVEEARKSGVEVISIMFGDKKFIQNAEAQYRLMYTYGILRCTPEDIGKKLISVLQNIVRR